MVIFSCSLSRAVHLELVTNLETTTFLPCLRRLIARRGRLSVICSDNESTFIKAAKWLTQVRRDEEYNSFLEFHDIKRKFNLSRSPWWRGQFERLIDFVKATMYKVIGRATLSSDELSQVLLDADTQVNHRPLSYVEDDIELPILTPASFLFQRYPQLPEQPAWKVKDKDLKRRSKFLKSCKDQLWNRWQQEHLTSLRESHNLVHKVAKYQVEVGDAVIVRSESKNRAIVEAIYLGPDVHTPAVQLRTSKNVIKRPVQHLYPPSDHEEPQRTLQQRELRRLPRKKKASNFEHD